VLGRDLPTPGFTLTPLPLAGSAKIYAKLQCIVLKIPQCLYTGSYRRCRLSLLTNSALVIRVQMRGREGVARSQPMSTSRDMEPK
jgi:hypothetical protein